MNEDNFFIKKGKYKNSKSTNEDIEQIIITINKGAQEILRGKIDRETVNKLQKLVEELDKYSLLINESLEIGNNREVKRCLSESLALLKDNRKLLKNLDMSVREIRKVASHIRTICSNLNKLYRNLNNQEYNSDLMSIEISISSSMLLESVRMNLHEK